MVIRVRQMSFVVGRVQAPFASSSVLAEGMSIIGPLRDEAEETMAIRLDGPLAGGSPARADIEAALRWLATRKDGEPLRFLRYAIDEPGSESAAALGCLVEPTASPAVVDPESRAFAVWGLRRRHGSSPPSS
jgi:hypothetical protein